MTRAELLERVRAASSVGQALSDDQLAALMAMAMARLHPHPPGPDEFQEAVVRLAVQMIRGEEKP